MNEFQRIVSELSLPDRGTHQGITFYSIVDLIEALDAARVLKPVRSHDDWAYNEMLITAAAEEMDAVIYEYPRGAFCVIEAVSMAVRHSCWNVIENDLS